MFETASCPALDANSPQSLFRSRSREFVFLLCPHQEEKTLVALGDCRVFFLRWCPNAETLSRHESPDCGGRGGLRMRSNADTTNAT
ncbi:hypothetical protein EVAR_36951_1 [Eumeta japonica]|uniref:Uncharacterized protein n=1 Tax=Eumeta variegata TaxID=151549 RepID=A0A4C1W6Z1_EUMVA|nr:hypothetical protein EVAR_36951_1 [Eumeta japonica]